MTPDDESMHPLSNYEFELLQKARALQPGDPPLPWHNSHVHAAAGVIAAGWTHDDLLLLISREGYSLNNPFNGQRVLWQTNLPEDWRKDYLHFYVAEFDETVNIFGEVAGDGVRFTEDDWELEVISPWWPRQEVILIPPAPNGGYQPYLEAAFMIGHTRLDGWLRCGFSIQGTCFAIIGSGGAYTFCRG